MNCTNCWVVMFWEPTILGLFPSSGGLTSGSLVSTFSPASAGFCRSSLFPSSAGGVELVPPPHAVAKSTKDTSTTTTLSVLSSRLMFRYPPLLVLYSPRTVKRPMVVKMSVTTKMRLIEAYSFYRGGARQPHQLANGPSMRGYKGWRNFGEFHF